MGFPAPPKSATLAEQRGICIRRLKESHGIGYPDHAFVAFLEAMTSPDAIADKQMLVDQSPIEAIVHTPQGLG